MAPSPSETYITGDHKTQLLSDGLHASVVLTVVIAVSTLAGLHTPGLPPDVLGAVYGGAIGYAAGRAGSIVRRPRIYGAAVKPGGPSVIPIEEGPPEPQDYRPDVREDLRDE